MSYQLHEPEFEVKDSGARQQFASGMVRDVTDGKIDYTLALDGPMFKRVAVHLTKGATKYAKRNWMQADGPEEAERFRESALRHFLQWYWGELDEDHAAAVYFNINGFEYVQDKLLAEFGAPSFEEFFGTDITTPEIEKDRVWVNGTEVDGPLRDEIIESLMWGEANDA